MNTHIVFDFDCTLSQYHLFHTIRSGEHYSKSLYDYFSRKCGTPDRASGKIIRWITKLEQAWDNNELDADHYRYMPTICNFSAADDFLDFLFGGKERLENLRSMLDELKSKGCTLHISTKGNISEVIACMLGARLLSFFQFVEGYDNINENKILYAVGKGFQVHEKLFFARASELEDKGNVTMFMDKVVFMKHVKNNNPGCVMYYLDDDAEFYEEATKCGIICIDIGRKEQYYDTNKPNLGYQQMKQLLKTVLNSSEYQRYTQCKKKSYPTYICDGNGSCSIRRNNSEISQDHS